MVTLTEGVAMVATAESGGQFSIHIVPVEEYLIITRMSLFLVVMVGRSIALRRRLSFLCDRQDGQVQEVPVALARMGKAIDERVFILIARA